MMYVAMMHHDDLIIRNDTHSRDQQLIQQKMQHLHTEQGNGYHSSISPSHILGVASHLSIYLKTNAVSSDEATAFA
jgi:hypothetical protein